MGGIGLGILSLSAYFREGRGQVLDQRKPYTGGSGPSEQCLGGAGGEYLNERGY